MPADNRIKTFTEYTDGTTATEEVTASDLNELQDRIVSYRACSQEQGNLSHATAGNAHTWSGATWIYGEFTCAASGGGGYVTKILDSSRDWTNRACQVYATWVTAAAGFLPSQASHYPSNIPVAQRVSYFWNTKAGTNVAAPTEGTNAWRPWPATYGTGYFAVNAANGNLVFCNNEVGANIEVYFLVMMSKDIDGNTQTENRVLTIDNEIDERILDATELNELQDCVVMSDVMSTISAGFPTNWRGAQWLYGEFTVADGDAELMDDSDNYWDTTAIDYRYRPIITDVGWATSAAALPSGVSHTPTNISATNDRLWSTDDGNEQCNVIAPATNISMMANTASYDYWAGNTSGATVYIYAQSMMCRADDGVDGVDVAENRLKSMADYGRVTTRALRAIEDNAVFYYAMNQEEGALPAPVHTGAGSGFCGGTWFYSENLIAARPGGAGTFTNVVLDNTLTNNWQDRIVLLYVCDIATGGGYTLPGAPNYEPNIGTGINAQELMVWDTGSDVVVGAPAVGNHAYNFNLSNVWFYADSVAGDFYVSNGTAGAVTMQIMAFVSGKTR